MMLSKLLAFQSPPTALKPMKNQGSHVYTNVVRKKQVFDGLLAPLAVDVSQNRLRVAYLVISCVLVLGTQAVQLALEVQVSLLNSTQIIH